MMVPAVSVSVPPVAVRLAVNVDKSSVPAVSVRLFETPTLDASVTVPALFTVKLLNVVVPVPPMEDAAPVNVVVVPEDR